MRAYREMRKFLEAGGRGSIFFKREYFYMVMESLVALFPAITWKTGAVPNELSDVVKEISGQGVETGFL